MMWQARMTKPISPMGISTLNVIVGVQFEQKHANDVGQTDVELGFMADERWDLLVSSARVGSHRRFQML